MTTNYPTSYDDNTSMPPHTDGDVIYAAADTTQIGAIKELEARVGIRGTEPFINVKLPPYNAVGDGATDDTTAVVAAITAAGSGEVHFPAGTYLVSNLAAVGTGNVRLTGAGPTRTVIKAKTGATGVLVDLTFAAASSNVEVRDLSIDCQNAIGMTGLRADRTNRLLVHDVNFRYGVYGFEFITRAGVGPFTLDSCNFQNQTTAPFHYTGTTGHGSSGNISKCVMQVTDGTTVMTQGVLIDWFSVGLLFDKVQVLGGVGTNLIHSGIVYNTAVPSGVDGAFLFFNECVTDAMDTGNGLDLTNARQVQSSSSFWSGQAAGAKSGVSITGGHDFQFSNDWISANGMTFASAPDRTAISNCTFPQTVTGGALVMPASSPPTNLTLSNNRYYTSITNDPVKLAAALNDQSYPTAWNAYLKPTAALVEAFPRFFVNNATLATTSGTLRVVAVSLPAGFTISNIAFMSGTTALTPGTTTHQIFCLFNSAKGLLAYTTDGANAAWGATTVKALGIAKNAAGGAITSYTTTYSGLHYLGFMVNADTGNGGVMPTLENCNFAPAAVNNLAPVLAATTSDTGLTTTPPTTFGTTTAAASVYAYVS